MKFFAVRRTNGDPKSKFKGVETPSQQRFVEYFSQIINEHHGRMPKTRVFKLDKIVLENIKGTADQTDQPSAFDLNFSFLDFGRRRQTSTETTARTGWSTSTRTTPSSSARSMWPAKRTAR